MSGPDSSDDDDFHFESTNVGSKRYPVHDCCEFEDSESLRRMIFVPQDGSDDDGDSSSEHEGDDSSSDENDSTAAMRAAAIGHSPKPIVPTLAVNVNAAQPAPFSKTSTGSDTPECENAAKKNATDNKSADIPTNKRDGEGKTEGKKEMTEGDGERKVSFENAHENKKASSSSPKSGTESENVEGNHANVTPEVDHSEPSSTEDKSKHSQGKNGNSSAPPEAAPPHKRIKKKKKKKPSYYCPYDLNERDEDENTPLHVAIHASKLEHVRLLLEAGASPHRKCNGSFPVHTAISMGAIEEHANFARDCVALLSGQGADLSMKDDSVHTPLYLACMMNLPRVVSLILSTSVGMSTLNARADRSGGRALHAAAKFDVSGGPFARRPSDLHSSVRENADGLGARPHVPGITSGAGASSKPAPHSRNPVGALNSGAYVTQILLAQTGIEVDAQSAQGHTPLHIGCSRGNWDVVRLLLNAGANTTITNRRGYTPGHLAHKRGMPIPNDLLQVLGNRPVSNTMAPPRDLVVDPDSTTYLISHELCLLHRSCPPIRRDVSMDPPPENVRRLHVLVNEKDGILRSGEFNKVVWQGEARRAAMTDILKCHEYTYVQSISQMCTAIPDHPSAIAHLDADTAVSRWSFEAAMRAAGSVCDAVDKVVCGEHRNAFCAVRPPGHHAGPRGVVRCANDPDGGSHGFCLLNNVAIGAAYARSMYRHEGIKKIAIVDFDVHHGNGTEEIIRQLMPAVEKAVVRTPFAFGELVSERYSPWLDETDIENVFFASTHGYGPRGLDDAGIPQQGGWFYPASGKTRISDAVANPSMVETPNLVDFIVSQTWTRMGEDSKMNCCKIINCGLALPARDAIPGMQRLELRDTYRKNILPRLKEFDPDIIFISAGFDAHKKDTMNFGYVGMVEDDYEWVTEQLVKIANSCCNGRIISVLEGGYRIHGGIVSPFARSVASHVRALVDGGSSRELYDPRDGAWESQFELHILQERERKRQQKQERQNQLARRQEEYGDRKRKRNQVDYRELYEAMKREGFAG